MGDRKTYNPEEWVEQYGDYLYGFALARVQDPSTAEDIVQETFLAALHSLKNFKGRSSERTWLTGILKHKIVDYYRKKAKEQPIDDIEYHLETIDEVFYKNGQWKVKPAKWAADPQKFYEERELMKVLHNCLSELTSRLSSAFILREMIGESTEEICKVLNITATNLWVILYRARMNLRRCLEINWFAPDIVEDS